MASNMGVKEKKTDYTMIAIYAVAIIAMLVVCTWGGYVFEMTSSPEKGLQIMTAISEINNYMNPQSFIRAIGQIFIGDGTTKKGFIIGIMGAVLIVLYKLSSGGKRYHRKGSEHGSARWGNKQEKNIIADTKDFYNNVICASDVFLVLDRKNVSRMKMQARKRRKRKKRLKGLMSIVLIVILMKKLQPSRTLKMKK